MKRTRLFLGAVLCGLLLFSEVTAADTVILTPGTIQGVISIEGHSFVQGVVQASSGSLNAVTQIANEGYLLTVQGDEVYNTWIWGQSSLGGYWSITRNEPKYVPIGGAIINNVTYNTGAVAGTISILGGTFTSANITLDANTPDESYSYSFTSASPSFFVPMIINDSLTMHVYVDLEHNGTPITIPLGSQAFSLPQGGASLKWDIDLAFFPFGTISGNVVMDGGAGLISSQAVNVTGKFGTPTEFMSKQAHLDGNGDYSIPEVVAGDYSVSVSSMFLSPYGYLWQEYGGLTVDPNGAAKWDLATDLAFVSGTFFVDGFIKQSAVTGGQIYSYGADRQAQSDVSAADASFALALTPGDWTVDNQHRLDIDVQDLSNPSHISLWSNSGSLPATLNSGDVLFSYDPYVMTVKSKIIFDIAEPLMAPEQEIEEPALRANGSDAMGISKSFTSVRMGQASGRPVLWFVGEPGNYNAVASAKVNGSEVDFASFNLEVPVPVHTEQNSLIVQPLPELTLIFSSISQDGWTAATASPIGPQPGQGLMLTSDPPVYYNITTTAEFGPLVTICIFYGMPLKPQDESNFLIKHYNENANPPDWEDLSNVMINPVAHSICGDTSGFSVFAVMVQEDTDSDGVLWNIDNCPDAENPTQADSDFDGVGDACDVDPTGSSGSGGSDGVGGSGDAGGAGDGDGDNVSDTPSATSVEDSKIRWVRTCSFARSYEPWSTSTISALFWGIVALGWYRRRHARTT